MTKETDNPEALREALLNLDRLREQEKTARLQMETLVGGLQVLNECQSINSLYREILDCLHGLINFDCAAILMEETEGYLTSVVQSDDRLRFNRVPITGVFKRALSGRGTVLTHLKKVSGWPVPVKFGAARQSTLRTQPLEAALLATLSGADTKMLLVCASEVAGGFKRKDLTLLESFTPLATQAVCRASEMERLSCLVTTLHHQSHFDLLTGLPNRTLLEKRLDSIKFDACTRSLMFLDLDNFKTVNDTFGHAIGDVLLSEVAFRISTVIGRGDTVARLGGDEFALLINSADTEQSVAALCDRILEAIRQPLFVSGGRIIPNASIGVLFDLDADDISQVQMQKADIAMYEAKHNGRNQYRFFCENMASKVQCEFDIETSLPIAIRNEEFHLVYQPIVSVSPMHCNKVEVLIRWGEGEKTVYTPYQFIPLAEKTGAIVELGQWIVSQALKEFEAWLAECSDNVLSINISQVQLQRPGYADEFIALVTDANVDFHQIELELSENIIAECIDNQVMENINALWERGVRFSFDDFGTGSSSLLHLQKIHGKSLKIDKSFVDELVANDENRRLVAGMIDFGHHLNMNIVAEGVETDAQMQILVKLGIDDIQGYLLAKPARADQTLALLAQWEGFQAQNMKIASGY